MSDLVGLLKQLRTAMPGQVATPGSPEYDRRVECFNEAISPHPLAVVSPIDSDALSRAVALAAEFETPFGVHLTGHGIADDYAGRLMFTLNALDSVVINPAGSAWIGAGAVWAQVVTQAAQVGLAPPCGSSSGVGAAGYTMGGGIGNLGRRYGYAADNVTAIDLVLADGRSIRATRDVFPDLFWGVRGSKSGLGIVTGFEIDLFPVPSLFGGTVSWPISQAPAVLRAFEEWSRSVPDELSTSVAITRYPDLDGVPTALRGVTLIALRVAYIGEEIDAQTLVAPMRLIPGIVDDCLRTMDFADSDSIHADPADPAVALEWTGLLDQLGDATIDRVCGLMSDSSFGIDVVEIRRLGGQYDREPADRNCVDSRGAAWNAFAAAVMARTATQHERDAAGSALDLVSDAFRTDVTDRVMLNFVGARQSANLVNAWSPEKRARLRTLKSKYDPSGLLWAPFE